jgi:indole-3-glycerol phosphate synthase
MMVDAIAELEDCLDTARHLARKVKVVGLSERELREFKACLTHAKRLLDGSDSIDS